MTSRPVLIALFVSLALNLFLAGAIVGGLVIGAKVKTARGDTRASGPLWAAADDLAPPQRQAFRQALRGEAGAVGQSLREARRVRREAWSGLANEPFDPKLVIDDLDRARTREIEARAAVEHRIVDFAATLSPQDRGKLAQGLSRSAPRDRRAGPPPGP